MGKLEFLGGLFSDSIDINEETVRSTIDYKLDDGIFCFKADREKMDADTALETNNLKTRVEQIKDPYWQQRLSGLALKLGEFYVIRNNNIENREKYERFVEKYIGQIEKAEDYQNERKL